MPDEHGRVTKQEAMNHLLGEGFRWGMTLREMWLRLAARQYLRDHPHADVSLILAEAEQLREQDRLTDEERARSYHPSMELRRALIIAVAVAAVCVGIWLLAQWIAG